MTGCGGRSSTPPARDWRPSTPLRIPPVLEPAQDPSGAKRVALSLQEGVHAFLPGKPTPTWGINGPILGPTVRLRRGSRVAVAVTNRLPELTTLHWHGLNVPAVFDGGPHQPIEPGATWRPTFTVDQPAATLWYHPHPHGSTALHVHRGLAGMLWIDDPATPAELPHRYGVDDVPLVLQDRTIGRDGQSLLTTEPNFGFMGTDMCVNATLQPFFTVTSRLVRFRLLNGSNARLYNLEFSDGRTFQVVGNDLGLLPAPVSTERLRLGPAERAEIVVPFGPGEAVTLLTRGGTERIDAGDHNILELRAAPTLAASAPLPGSLGGEAPLVPAPDATVRPFRLQGHDAINGREMDMARVDEVVTASTTEVWEIENTVYSHNFHIHGVSFTVLDVAGSPPPPWARGRRDTVHLPEKQSARLAVEFGPFADAVHPYMYHCHILRHEDAGMMGQYVVVRPGDESTTPRIIGAMATHPPGHSVPVTSTGPTVAGGARRP